jgi:hypothetical protein
LAFRAVVFGHGPAPLFEAFLEWSFPQAIPTKAEESESADRFAVTG